MPKKINAKWHARHPLRSNSSLIRRIAWHQAHAKACGCRPVPASIRAEIKRQAVAKTRRPTRRPRGSSNLPAGMVRLDYPRVRGYLVRVGYTRTRKGWRPINKAYFGDSRFGGPRKARTAADAWLKRLLKTRRAKKRKR